MDRSELERRYRAHVIAERASRAADSRFQDGLAAYRRACPHDGAVVELRADDGSVPSGGTFGRLMCRFCLRCGLMERAEVFDLSGGGVFPLTGMASKVFLKDCGSDLSVYLQAFNRYDQRLRIFGRFDEFDAQGEWIGAQDIVATPGFDPTPALQRIAELNDEIRSDFLERVRIVSALQSACPHEGEIIDRHVKTIVFPHDDPPDSPRRTCVTCLFEEVGTHSGFPGVHDFKVLTGRSATCLSTADYDTRRYELLQRLGLDFLIRC